MLRSCALPLAFTVLSLITGCYSSDDEDDGSSPGGGSGSTSGGRGGGGNGSGGSASGAGGSAQGGTDTAGTSSGGTSNGGTSSGGTSQGGSSGSSASCVTETIVLGESQTMSADCGPALPEGVDDGMINVFYGSSVGGGVKVCRRASSQGCDPHGWWSNGGDILLCDQTCSAFFDNPGMVLYIEVGCESDTCL